MATSIVAGTAAKTPASGTSLVVTVPATAAGEVSFIAIVVNNTAGAVVTPAGWTPISSAGSAGQQPSGTGNAAVSVIWREWQSGDPTTVTLTSATAARIVAIPFKVVGGLASAPVEANAVTLGSSTTAGVNIAAPTVTAVDARQLVSVYGIRVTPTAVGAVWTPSSSGLTTLLQDTTAVAAVTNVACLVAVTTLSAAGATGTKMATANQTGYPVGFSLVLEPAPVTAGRPKVWSGTAWAQKPCKVWNGSAWVEKPMKVWTGSAWKTLT